MNAEDAERHKGDQSGKDDRNGPCNLQVVANPIKGVSNRVGTVVTAADCPIELG
ncbi:hypothetical protein [uncultured Ilumatobacter sp.]|uniref:hypothetical protein n=1 Tax=uncultured Ilumatobacter sp. TaxID=879968 RepID=UPI00374FA075